MIGGSGDGIRVGNWISIGVVSTWISIGVVSSWISIGVVSP